MNFRIKPMQAIGALLTLTLITGGGNLWASWTEVHNATAAQHHEQVLQEQAGLALSRKLCTTFGKLAENKPPAGNPRTNPSRAYEQDEHEILDQLGIDLGCKP